MANVPPSLLLHEIRRLTAGPSDPRSDRELLERFVVEAHGESFAELVRRHGPMVLRVCRRVLGEPADAEDAFQATFLVLARKAAAVRGRDCVAGFLYGVAFNVARRRGAAAVRRATHERRALTSGPAEPLGELTARELFEALDEELGRLPEKVRTPLVLCHLEGLTRDEAARQLNCPLGTLKDRLERGKRLLRVALARRGVSVPAALAVLLAADVAQAAVPAALAETAVRSALAAAALPATTAASALAQAALRPSLAARWKVASALLLAVGAVAGGLGLWPQRSGDAQPAAAAVQPGPRTDANGDPLPAGAIARLGSLRLRHAGLAHYVFSEDGKTVRTVGSDRVLRSWDVATGQQVRALSLEGTARIGWATAFAPDAKTVAAQDGGAIVLWETQTGKQVKTLPAPKGQIHSIYFSPDGTSLVVATWEGQVIFLDWQKGGERRVALPVRKIGQDSTYHTHLSPDGRWLVGGGGAGESLCVFDQATGREIHRFRCNAMTSAVSADSKTLAVCGMDATKKDETVILFYDLTSGKEVARFPLGHHAGYFSVAFSADGKSLACGSSDRSFVMDCTTGHKKFALPDRPFSLDFSPDGSLLAANTGSRLRFWDAATGKERHPFSGEFGSILVAAVSGDGRLLAAADWMDRSVSLWDLTTGQLRAALPLKGETRYVRDLSFSPDGRTLGAAQLKGFVQFWDVATGREQRTVQLTDPTRTLGPEYTYFFHLYLSPDTTHVTTLEQMVVGVESTRLAVWETATGKLLRQHTLPPKAKTCAWSAEGTTVALALNEGLRLVEVDTGIVRFRVPGTSSNGPLAASPDDRLLATPWPKGHSVGVWEAATGKEVARLVVGAAANLALTPDDRYLVTTDPHALHVWDLATGKERRRWPLPLEGTNVWGDTLVNRLVLTPDGHRAITALADGTALVWDLTPALGSTAPLEEPSEKKVAQWWADLADDDAGRAYAAMWRLTDAPQSALPLLRRHLRVTTDADLVRARALIADLNDDTFALREKALRQLEALGDTAAPALRRALAKDPPPEVRRRIEQLLEGRRGVALSGEPLRICRAVAVLEHKGTPEARRLLQELAAGLAESLQTQQAQTALARLGRRGQ